jgi:hypothetical protein
MRQEGFFFQKRTWLVKNIKKIKQLKIYFLK